MRKVVLCFGDSNTHGYNALTGGRFTEEERWTCLLQHKLGDTYRIIEEGLSGRTTLFEDPLNEGLSGIRAITPCLLTHEPVNLLIIMLGTNDTKERFHASPELIGDGLAQLIKKAHGTRDAWKESSNILVISPVNIKKGCESSVVKEEMGKECVEKSRLLADLFEPTARELGCSFLDINTIPGVDVIPTDYMHLSKTAHAALAHALAEMIPHLV